ncbi:hypothetical protein C8Q79DRAFT_1114986 [Trametes meyenii]|nr:hypothetical protein C8Q79DRAFT_1114986 [Trametes meyenii]
MSLALLRRARPPCSLAGARRAASVSRCYSAAATIVKTRDESDSQDDAPVAGPSSRQLGGESIDSSEKGSKLRRTVDASEPPEPFSRVQSYLARINATGLEPTLEDLDRCRPRVQPPPSSPQYAETYTELLNTLSRSFTKEQMRGFLVQTLGTSRHCATHRRKAEYAESIIEQLWKWPTLKDVEKAKRDKTEVTTKILPVTASELFLILGKDGQDLLRLSKDFDVHISLRRQPMALRIEGTRGTLKELADHIIVLRKSFMEEEYDLPSPIAIPPDMIQRISRLAAAYLENVSSSPGKLRIVAKDEQSLSTAKRLASRALHEIRASAETPLLTYLPTGAGGISAEPLMMYPHNYALYPYFSPRPLPFTMNSSGTFRLRRVGEWLTSDFTEDVKTTGGLAEGKGHVLSVTEQQEDLREALLRNVRTQDLHDQSQIVVKAAMGHMLLTRASGQQQATLVPPLTGEHQFGKVRKWIAQNPVKMTFVPDLPLPLLNTPPARQNVKHRLVYHVLPTGTHNLPQDAVTSEGAPSNWKRVLALEITLSRSSPSELQQPTRTELPQRDLAEGLSDFDLELDLEEAAQPLSPSFGEPSIPILDATDVHCWTGVEADVNLMIPDRPMDLQLTARRAAALPDSQQPAELQRYVAELRAYLQGAEDQPEQPSPPLLLHFGGERYILHSNASVKQGEEEVCETGRPTLKQLEWEKLELTHALCESTLDLETNQRSIHCEVTCGDVTSDEAWARFLRDCDRLSVMRELPKGDTASVFLEDDDRIESMI